MRHGIRLAQPTVLETGFWRRPAEKLHVCSISWPDHTFPVRLLSSTTMHAYRSLETMKMPHLGPLSENHKRHQPLHKSNTRSCHSRYSFHKTIIQYNIYQSDQDVKPRRWEYNRQQEDRPFLPIRNSSYSGSPSKTDREWYVPLIHGQRCDKEGEITQSDVDLVKQGYRWMSVSATVSRVDFHRIGG